MISNINNINNSPPPPRPTLWPTLREDKAEPTMTGLGEVLALDLACLLSLLSSTDQVPTRSTNPDPSPALLESWLALQLSMACEAGAILQRVCCERNGETFINGTWRFHGTVGGLFNALTNYNYRILHDKATSETTIVCVIHTSSAVSRWKINQDFFPEK